MVLTQVQSGKDYIIHALDGEGEVRLHLEGMGFVPGTKLSVVSRIGDNLIVNVKGSKVALDASLAKCVIV
ncbi:MAG: ferrous iron transport protein A [Eggerthellaceae bacterium]|nr:ferrous iron transport protein A [Eggerthellaceae bacterium]